MSDFRESLKVEACNLVLDFLKCKHNIKNMPDLVKKQD